LSAPYPRNKDPRYRYKPIPPKELGEFLKKFGDFCDGFLNSIKYPDTWHVHVSSYALMEILDRVDKREAYYYYFHPKKGSGVEINERKLGGLFAYWILKFRPISVDFDNDLLISKEQHQYANNINEYFAAYTLYSWLSKWYRATQQKPLDLNKAGSSNFHNALVYAFRYRNISIDAMMVLVESIVTETFTRNDIRVV